MVVAVTVAESTFRLATDLVSDDMVATEHVGDMVDAALTPDLGDAC